MTGTKQLVFAVLFLLLLSINVSAFALSQALSWTMAAKDGTWTIQALDTAVPGAGQAINFVINPQGSIEAAGLGKIKEALGPAGKIIDGITNPQGLITQGALETIAKDNPETAGALGEVLTVKNQLSNLGIKDATLNLDKEGSITELSPVYSQPGKEAGIGNIIGKDIKEDDFKIRNVKLSKENGITTIEAGIGSEIKIKNKEGKIITYKDFQPGTFFKFDETGTITEATILPSASGSYYLDERKLNYFDGGGASKSKTRIVYKDGAISLSGSTTDDRFQLEETDKTTKKKTIIEIRLFQTNSQLTIKDNHYSGKGFEIEAENNPRLRVHSGGLRLGKEIIFDPNSEFEIGFGDPIKLTNGGKIILKPFETTLASWKESRSTKHFEAIIEGEEIYFNVNKRAKGKISLYSDYFYQNRIKLHENTQLDLMDGIDETTLTSLVSEKPILYYTTVGECSVGQNCLEINKGALLVNSLGNNNLRIQDYKGQITSLTSKKITDASKVEFTQKDTTIVFSKDPFKVQGNLKDTSVESIDTEYVKAGQTRIQKFQLIETTPLSSEALSQPPEKIPTFSECPPCLTVGGSVDQTLKVRLNSLNANKAQVKAYITENENVYGVRPMNLLGYYDDKREEKLITSLKNAAEKYPDLSPTLLIAAANQEGLILWTGNKYYKNPDAKVSGFNDLGLDKFSERVGNKELQTKKIEELKNSAEGAKIDLKLALEDHAPADKIKELRTTVQQTAQNLKDYTPEKNLKETGCGINLDKPCLRPDFTEFTLDPRENEKYEPVYSANFPTLEPALEAFGAQLYQTQSKFLYDARRTGINTNGLTKKQVDYWTYVYYNSGEAEGLKFLKGAKERGELIPKNRILPPTKTIKTASGGTRETVNAEHNAMRVATSAELLDIHKIFDAPKPILQQVSTK
ncbi:MAG: hypothetical protein WC595_00140 [Candidatus Nanoarchaeia archaeon]